MFVPNTVVREIKATSRVTIQELMTRYSLPFNAVRDILMGYYKPDQGVPVPQEEALRMIQEYHDSIPFSDGRTSLTAQQIKDIAAFPQNGQGTTRFLATKHNVSTQTIRNIRAGRVFTELTAEVRANTTKVEELLKKRKPWRGKLVNIHGEKLSDFTINEIKNSPDLGPRTIPVLAQRYDTPMDVVQKIRES